MFSSFWSLFYEKAWFYVKRYDQLYSLILYLLIVGILTPALLFFTKYNFGFVFFFWIIAIIVWILLAAMGVKVFRR